MTDRSHPSRSGLAWIVFYAVLAIINTIAALTAGPEFWGWDLPDGINGLVGGACWVFCIEAWIGRSR